MSKIIEILETYEDFEIAYFHKHLLNTYTKNTSEKVAKYIKEDRKLDTEKINSIISQHENKKFEDNKERCPRCKSDKIKSEMVEWDIPVFHPGFEDEDAMIEATLTGKKKRKEKNDCNVCGFNLKDPNNPTLKEQIIGYLFDDSIWWDFFKRKR